MMEFLREYYAMEWALVKNPWYWRLNLGVVGVAVIAYAIWRVRDRVHYGFWSWV